MLIQPDDQRLRWEGAISISRGDGWVQPWRLPTNEIALWHDGIVEKAGECAGVRLTLRTDATSIRLILEPEHTPLINAIALDEETETISLEVDLTIGGKVIATQDIAYTSICEFPNLPDGKNDIEIWLPQSHRFRLRGMELENATDIAVSADNRPRWVQYGSSISQCKAAYSPSQTWPAIVATRAGFHHTNLGYGGQGHLEVVVARMIRDLPADYISMQEGLNAFGSGSLNPRTYLARLIGFVRILREGHPFTPLAIFSPPYNEICAERTLHGESLDDRRSEIAKAVKTLRDHGDSNVHYVHGPTLLGPEDAHLLGDGVHPSAEGYRVLAERFTELVVDRYFKPRRP
jgi:lysophospholipase L1-like esterase